MTMAPWHDGLSERKGRHQHTAARRERVAHESDPIRITERMACKAQHKHLIGLVSKAVPKRLRLRTPSVAARGATAVETVTAEAVMLHITDLAALEPSQLQLLSRWWAPPWVPTHVADLICTTRSIIHDICTIRSTIHDIRQEIRSLRTQVAGSCRRGGRRISRFSRATIRSIIHDICTIRGIIHDIC